MGVGSRERRLGFRKEENMEEESINDLPRPQGDLDLIEAVIDHWEQFLGPCTMVYDEIVSEFVHIDVYQFGPDPISGLTTFVTSGMAEKPMNVPAEVSNPENYQYAELVLQVQNHWIRSLGDVPVYQTWPIRELRNAALLPHKRETWVWCGHTIRTDSSTTLAPDTMFCATTVWPGFILPEGSWNLKMDDGRDIVFLSLGFLYPEELEFSKQNYQDGFMDYLDEIDFDIHDVIIFSPDRPNTCAPTKRHPWWKRKGR